MLAGRFDMMEDQGTTVSADKGWKVHTVSPLLTHPSLPQDSFTFPMDNDLDLGAKAPARAVSPMMPSASALDHSASPLTFLADNALALGQQPHKVEPAAVKYPLRSMTQGSPSPPHMGLTTLSPLHQFTSSLTTPGDKIPEGGLLSEGAEPVNASHFIRPIVEDLTTAVQSAAAEATTVQKDEDSNAHKGAPTALLPAVQPTDPSTPQQSSALNSLADSTAVVQPEGNRPTSPKPGAVCSSHDGSFTAAAGSAASPTEPHTVAHKIEHVSLTAPAGAESTSSEGPRVGAALKKASGEGQKDADIAEAHAAKMSSAAVTTADAMPGVEHAGGKEGRTRAAGKGITNSKTVPQAAAAAVAAKITLSKRRQAAATKQPPVKPSAEPQDSAAAAATAKLPCSKASASQVSLKAVDAPELPKHQYGTRSACAAVFSKVPSGLATMTSKQPVAPAAVRKQDSYQGTGASSLAKPAVSKQPKARVSGIKGGNASSEAVQQRAAVASQPPVAAVSATAAKHSSRKAAAPDGGKASGISAQQGAATAVKGPVTRAAARQQSKSGPISQPVPVEQAKPKRPSRAAKETGKPKPAGTVRQQVKARVGTAPADPVSAKPMDASTARAAAEGRQERQADPRAGQGTLPSKPGYVPMPCA